MNSRKTIINSGLTVIVAINLAGTVLPSAALDESETQVSVDSLESGAKGLHLRPVASKTAPCATWLPPSDVKPRLAMLCIHGFSLHKGCFAAFGKEMAKDGIATYAMDLRGFGELKDQNKHSGLDFDGCLADIKAVLEQIHLDYPGLPVVLLGESMGGAVALRAAAFYPDLVSGLISSVPARDRFGMNDEEKKVMLKSGLQTIFGGYKKKIDHVAMAAVNKISVKEDVRKEWKNDPLMRTDFSPQEFLQFDEFMGHNLQAAAMVKTTPVLFIQGTNDKLIRPAGTWKLFERLGTPNRQMVLSKNSEHLIFEEGQFKPDDLKFVTSWIDKNIISLDPTIVTPENKLAVVAGGPEEGTTTDSSSGAATNTTGNGNKTEVAMLPPKPPVTEFKHRISVNSTPQINYWIELHRNGKFYRCNNKMEFKTGDSIRFHLIPESDGYAYLVMKASTTGKSDVLFPNQAYGTHNYLKQGQDYPIPAEGWMQFDDHPGTEQLGLVFSKEKLEYTAQSLQNNAAICTVSNVPTGAKDLCPTRMKLSWDDPMPVLIPDDFRPVTQVQSSGESSLVRLMSTTGEMVSASIQLMHNK